MCTKQNLQTFIRSGGFAWPGGYPCGLLMSDGETIDAKSARQNYRQIRRNMAPNDPYSADWTPIEVFVHWEGPDIYCAHSGRAIESAYGIPESA